MDVDTGELSTNMLLLGSEVTFAHAAVDKSTTDWGEAGQIDARLRGSRGRDTSPEESSA